MGPFGGAFEPPPLPGFPFGASSTFDADSIEDFYSQRLRRLASTSSPPRGQAPSGSQAPSGGQAPSSAQQTSPPAAATQPSEPPPPRTPPRLSSSSDVDATPTKTIVKTTTATVTETDSSSPSQATSGNVKACEFCGKCFRFQSNLIVHRRSHTGEKPYKCPLCPHACTQASKLKRHMKTHNSAQLSSVCGDSSILTSLCDGSENHSDEGSSSGSKTSNEEDGNSEGEEDCDEEEEEDVEELRRDEQFRQMLMSHQKAKRNDERPTDLSRRTDGALVPPALSSLSISGLVQSCTTAQQRSSLLSEMMDNSGLGNIQQYKEAFNQALALAGRRDDDDEEEEEEDEEDDDEDDDMELNGTMDDGEGSGNADGVDADRDKSAADNDVDLISDTERDGESSHVAKRLKLEPLAKSEHLAHGVPGGAPNHMFPPFVRDPRDLIYPNIWFPPPPGALNQHGAFNNAFMRAEPFIASVAMAAHHMCENGGSPMQLKTGASPKTSVGLTSPIHMPTSSPTRLSSSSSVAAAAVALSYRTRRRNDVCEYCGKIFKNCSNLTVHRRSHTGEKPYKCELCNYKCAQSSKLTRHMKTHGRLGKDIYRCKFCHMPFSVPSTLEKHMRKCVENHNPSYSPPQQQLPPLSLQSPVDGRHYSDNHSPLTPPQLPPLPAMTPIEDSIPHGYVENHSPLTPPHMPALLLKSPSERNFDNAPQIKTESPGPLDASKLPKPLLPSLHTDVNSCSNSVPNHSPRIPSDLSLNTAAAMVGDGTLKGFKENHSALSLSIPTDITSKDSCVRKFLANHQQLPRPSLDIHAAYMPSHQAASLLAPAMPVITNSSVVSSLLEVAPRSSAMTIVNSEASQ